MLPKLCISKINTSCKINTTCSCVIIFCTLLDSICKYFVWEFCNHGQGLGWPGAGLQSQGLVNLHSFLIPGHSSWGRGPGWQDLPEAHPTPSRALHAHPCALDPGRLPEVSVPLSGPLGPVCSQILAWQLTTLLAIWCLQGVFFLVFPFNILFAYPCCPQQEEDGHYLVPGSRKPWKLLAHGGWQQDGHPCPGPPGNPAPDPLHLVNLGLAKCSRKAYTRKSSDPGTKSMLCSSV